MNSNCNSGAIINSYLGALDSDNKCCVLKINKKFDSNNFIELIKLINDIYKYIKS